MKEKLKKLIEKLTEVKEELEELATEFIGNAERDEEDAGENHYHFSKSEQQEIDDLRDLGIELNDISELIKEDIRSLKDVRYYGIEERVESIIKKMR